MGTETAKTRSRHPIRGALLAAFADVGVSTLPAPGALAVGRDCSQSRHRMLSVQSRQKQPQNSV